MLAQILAIALTALVAMPLIAANPGELSGAAAPIGWAMLGGAFVFGAAMQVVLGCGSGTLVNAGSGNAVAVVALPFFALALTGMIAGRSMGAGIQVALAALAKAAGEIGEEEEHRRCADFLRDSSATGARELGL